ncbi:usherin [Thunnus albacares]|uniref:usherin n=1 Tax=Thunnus albacares TaxID=8236 RepID=UPI001CF65725|nr:usherin [Thunnus albacares]XP_044201966.1 usherin [Thunnus albacares]XP_044201973.1 usherin [Thunnus albacares]XP_044201980.1 usherin [Thunnus albacares]XP_044201989.1 usherin [Thunnus albacares]
MTAITYSSTARRPPKEIQVLEHPSASRNVPEPVSKSLDPRNMQEQPQNQILDSCGVKGRKWCEEKGGRKNEGGKLQRKRQTWGRGVSKERMKRGGKEQRGNRKIGKDRKGSWGERVDGKDKSETDVSGILSVAERDDETKQSEKWMEKRKSWSAFLWKFPLKNSTAEEMKKEKNIMKGMRHGHIFLWLPLFFLSLCPKPASSLGHFPRMENIAAFKPVSTSPARSTCGLPERSSYCQSASSQTELLMCYQAFCIQECPYRSSTPPYAPLLLPAHRGTCVTEDINDTRPGIQTEYETRTTSGSDGVSSRSGSVMFRPVQQGCLVSPPSQNLGALGSLTLALWMKPSSPGEMMLLEKSSGQKLVFSVTVSEQVVTLRYGQYSSQTLLMVSFRTEGRLALERWTHLVLQVHDRRVSLFLNGLEEDGTPFDTKPLTTRLYDISEDGAMWVGLSSNGSNQFIGRMQDFRFYPATLTNREIVEVYSGVLPQLHSQSECRCPPSHPRVHPLVERYCIPNAVEDTTNDRVLRLNLNAHPLSYINDQDMGTTWLSKIMTTQELDEGVTITVDFANGQYQVFYVIVQFGGLLPESVLIQRRRLDLTDQQSGTTTEQPWLDWQYIAKDCSVFEMQNNGPLLRPDSVNCLQLPSDVPYSGGNITISLLTPGPNLRPGYNDFYNTPELQKMVHATQVRIHLSGQYQTRAAGTNQRHRYYAINEITISGRCECHGHADHCDTSVAPYRCLCLPETHTEGNNCQHCMPLYNDKPFRQGNQLQPMSCRPCQCHGHAHSCHYDVRADDQPDEHYRGGGGVCDNCMHNTTGKNCELCISGFFRLEDSDPTSVYVCQPCNCHTAGTVNGSIECAQVAGQCKCKAAVTGRLCSDCLPGWYGLQASNPKGCIRCNCSDIGVISSSIVGVPSCHQDTGQCRCKPHVTGVSCDRCEFGYWNLSHPDGCIPCDCDPLGSLSPYCEPEGGQCECKPGVGGQRCDSCGSGLYGLRLEGSCTPCNCSQEGTVPGTDCDPHTGQCVCKEHVEGHHCDTCRHGYHTLEHRNSLGCLPCVCDISGTVPEGVCDMWTGQCPCRDGVEGAQCTNCAHNYYNRSSDIHKGLSQGCVPCVCDPRGTVAGSVCDSSTGQCICIPTRYGKDCSSCRPGFYLSTDQSMCVECDCHPMGASQRGCESQSGQCACAHPSVGGRRCDQCREMFFGFNPGLGRCQPCECDPVGSVNGSCNPDSGACVCKLLVTGDKCDVCQEGASHLHAENHYGCSKAPSQQPAPVGFALSYSSINLSWHPPDSPNSNKLNYTLIRDGQSVHSIQSHYPFSHESFEDTGLFPYTNYSYWLITANVAGVTISASASYQTLGAPPEADQLHLNLVGRPGPTSASFNWSSPRNDTGPVERFVLSSTESSSGAKPVIHYTGLSTETVASGLKPFTQYTVILEACSSGGCTSTLPLSLLTASAPPQNQPPPKVTATGPHALHVSWEPPSQPNGVITRYEVFLRGPMESLNFSSPAAEKRVFSSIGWLDPSVSPEAPLTNRSKALPPESSTTVAGLQAFSTYQMRVMSINMAGSVTSGWTTARTMEGVPEFMAPPEVSALSSTSLKVRWSSAEGDGVIARGPVAEYRVNLLTEQTNNPYAPPVVNQVLHRSGPSSQPVYLVKELKPYHVYNFTITICTKSGCITSLPSSGRTLPAAPTGLSSPRLHPVNETTIQIDWDPPAQLNGPHPLYQVERTDVSLSDPQGPLVRGTRFPGNSYYQFPSDTLPVNSDFTGVELSFKTRSPDGLLLCALSPGNQEEFLAVQIKNGRPYFLFDPQGSAVAVSVQGDGGRRYNDGQWHSIIATRRGAVGTIVVNNQYKGSASASSGSTIIGENTGVFIGGLPEDFTLLREDSGDARLMRQGFSGCLRDVSFKMTDSPSEEWKSLDWAKATKKMAVYERWEGCPTQTVDGAHFLGHGYLELSKDVFSGGEDFDISMDFRTDQLNALLLFTYNTQTEDYMLVELDAGLLSFIFACEGHVTELSMWVGLSYCDGDWKQLLLAKRGYVISAAVNDWAEETRGVGGAGRLRVDTPLYVGGVPTELIHPALDSRSHKHGLGGCIKGLTIRSDETNPPVSQTVNLSAASRRSLRVYLDGCPTSESRYNCRGNDSVLVFTGRKTQATDYSLQPFTEYLYRIVALAAGGWAAGPWQRGRSRGKVPVFVPPPISVQSLDGFSAKVSWSPPTGDIRGLIDRYELRAYNRDQAEAPAIKAIYLANGNFTGVLSGLTPSTRYIVTVSACIPLGCAESLRNDNGDDNDLRSSLRTPEEAPDAVSPPAAVSSPSALYVTWEPPARPNGGITEYLLYHNDQTVYRGNDRQHNITGLGVYSTHVLVLSACTSVGCTNSSQVTMLTSQLPPGPLQAPTLTLLDSRTLLVEWSRPSQVNGVLEFYSIFLSHGGLEPVLAYNSSGLFEDHTLRNLTPGTAYTVTLAACTGGGCTFSPPSQTQTEESTPENVPAPLVTPLSPHALNVSWTPPDTPNGIITSYGLWLDGVLILNSSSSQRFFLVKGLSPWSRHVLRLQACTARGCGKGPMVDMRTLEMAPEGPIFLELTNHSSRSVRARWTAPPRPNGNLSYTLYYKSKDGDGVLDGSTAAGSWLSVTDLQPYNSYSFWIRGCNTQGCVESLQLNVTTPPAAPDGLSPPRLAHATSVSLNVSWSAPAHSNAPGPLRYTLQMRTLPQRPVKRLLENATDTFSYYLEGLSPYTQYLFRVVVSHTHGQTAGPWATLRTAEDSPGALDTPAVSGLHPRSVTVTWVPPSQPNGIITNYTLYLHPSSISALDSKRSSVFSPSMSLNSSLGPNPSPAPSTEGRYLYSRHNLRPTSNVTTLSSSHISISTVRAHTNNPFSSSRPGISEDNQIESSRVNNTSRGPGFSSFHHTEPNTISNVNPSPSLLLSNPEYNSTSLNTDHFIKQDTIHRLISHSFSAASDSSSSPLSATVPGNTTSYTFLDLLPYQTYNIQLAACTSAGCSVSGTSQHFQTLPAPPEGLPAPHVYSDTPTSVLLSWGAPEWSNGPLERWVIERRVAGTKQVSTVGYLPPDPPPLSFLDSSSALSPWTSYQYRLVLHNQAGSTTGPWVNITTRPSRPAGLSPPRVNVLEPETLQVIWSPPLIPNGEIHGYEIRLPEPRIFHDSGTASELNVTITNLIPYTNYSITVLACSKGGGQVGGCTESLPTLATTLPASPQGLAPLSVVAVSESFLAISWQPPSRPNGPNIRYELLRCKTYQPLAITTVPTVTATSPPPSEDLHRWLHVYSGTKLFYQDKGLSRFTRYQYQLVVHNDMGYSSGEIVTAMTMAGIPFHPPSLSAHAINHTAVKVNWTQPSLHNLQGEVESYFLTIDSALSSQNMVFHPEIISTVITDLWPSTTYLVSLQVSNGAHNTTKAIVNVTTKDGEPDGMSAPEVVPVNSSTARVLWFPPQWPNGAITGYHIYVNDHLHGSVDNSSGSYLLGDLLPFTVYNIQVEVCTVYACVRSNVTQTTTVEDLPADLVTPHAQVVSARIVRLDWSHPGRPSGIMLGYEVLRRTLRSCVSGSAGVTSSVGEESGGAGGVRFTCTYLQCSATHSVCGTSCFHPDVQVCCNGLLYTKEPHHHCCEGSYLSFINSSNPVCCNGKLLPPLPDHQCCGGYYVHVKANEYCCPDHSQGRVSVGLGDSCCGGVPYSTKGGQLCCSGSLHDGYGVQCCRGRVVDDTLVCCGDAEREEVHTYIPGFVCCGPDYINSSTSLCCVGSDGFPTMHPAGNATVTLQCCGSKVIRQEEECCNGIGYDPQRHVCANRPTPGLLIQHQCMQATVCPVAAASTAYCGSCDLDPSMTACTWVLSADTHPDTPSTYSPSINTTQETLTTGLYIHTNRSDNTYKMANTHSHTHIGSLGYKGSLCSSHEEVVYSGDANRYTYTDSDLEPFTTYEYRVRGWNSFGRGSSDVRTVTTSEDKPWGVAPPRWSRLSERDDIIQLRWQAPARPNGDITHYVILRDGQERYRGDENSFTDVGGIRPFQEYSYQLQVCNRAGCTDSTQVVAVTVQGVPEGVQAPVVKALSPSSLHVSWSEPKRPNGRVQWYHLNQTGLGTIFTHIEGPRNYTVTGLQPYTDYSFLLVACTAVGCGASSTSTGRTLQAFPAGVWSRPRHLIINTSAVELYWDQPSQPNGHISQYRLNRDGHTIFTGDHRDQNYTDTGLLPNHRYVYELKASTGGGTGLSDKYVIKTPVSCPTGIPAPHNVTVSGPHSISLAWTPPAQFDSSQPVNYNILLNPGSDSAIMHHAGQRLHLSVTGLESFTTYYIRVQACQIEGCGVGAGVYVRTLEAAPEGLLPPTVKAAGASVLEIHWSPPQKPNGLITSYHIFRCPVGTEEELLVFIWSSGPLEFFDASPALQSFSFFQYRVRAYNSKGSVLSQWASAQTLQAEPQDMSPPTVTPTGGYSVHLKWSGPRQPNGLISHYRLVYKKHQQDPTLNSTAVTALTVEGSVLEATVYGLEPYSEYSLRVEAVNEAGSVSSQWAGTRTLEASPAGLANFTVEQREQGRSLLLSWDQPSVPNGVITMYNLYSEGNLEFSGLSRNFLFRRLEPWTTYTLILEACTSAGCTRTPPQHVTTAAAPPASQPPPKPTLIGPDHVSLTWGPPTQPNGPIREYFLLGRSLEEVGRGKSNEEDAEREKVLFQETSPQQTDTFSYTVTGLRPWTQYEFSIRTHNLAGHTRSPWVTVTTRQAPPRGLVSPTLSHLKGRPSEVLVSWTPPLEPNGVLQSYRIQRNNISFSFSFDPTVLNYTDEDLLPFSTYSYAITACTSEGCITSPYTNITTLEAPPATVEAPTVDTITSNSINISWRKPLTQNGEVTEYVLKLNSQEVYRGRNLNTELSDLQPHTSYQLVLLACTSGGCTTSATMSTVTEEASPTDLSAPTLKVTGPESVEVSWGPPEHPNGIITGYELRRDGEVIYVGTETHYHDFTLLPSVEYSYFVSANNSRGTVSSTAATAKTQPSAPSGVGLPTLSPLGPSQVKVEWSAPARPNGDIVSYTVYQRDPVQLRLTTSVYTPEDSAFSERHTTLQGLAPYRRYEVRVEACTALGCSSSDWSSILTLEAPPAGQTAPLLDLQPDTHTSLQTTFLLTWSPPAQPNGRILHYEVYRRLDHTTDTHRSDAATPVCRNVSTTCKDEGLLPYTVYQYQLWAVNSAGRSASPWTSGRTGPAPPEGVGPPNFLRVSATSAVMEIHPPARPNGIVSLYRVFSLDHNNHTLLSEGTSHQQTLHGLRPYTQYWVGVEACTCYQCCSQGPLSELHTLAAPPAHQPPPHPITLTSRSVQLEWDEPLAPNGVIESCELHLRSPCPQPPQPVTLPCVERPVEICFFGKRRSYNVTGLQPYSTYELRAACFNNMGSTASNWTTVTTLSEAPQYVSPFSVDSNLTVIWLDWAGSFSLNGYLKEYSVTESQLRVYTGFYSYLHIPRTSQKTLSFQVTCTTDSGSASTPTIRYSPATGLDLLEPEDSGKQGVSMSATPVYSELWFILLLALLGLFLLAILLGLVLQRALRKNPSARERPPLVMLQKTRQAGGEAYTRPCPELCSKHHSGSVLLPDRLTGLADTKIVGSSSRFSPISVLRVPSQPDISQTYSQHSLHRSVSQLIDRKSLMMEEGSWDNPLGHDSGLYVEEDEFVDAIKALSSGKKEHTMFTDTHL